MPDDSLCVYYRDSLVGMIVRTPADRMEFAYDDGWIHGSTAFPISQSLPLDGSHRHGVADHFYFANLLPEGDARSAVCLRLGISESNDFELLRRIGGECAGALTIIPAGDVPSHEGAYRSFDEDDLSNALKGILTGFRQFPGASVRFSLAGRQDKWAVYQDDKGNLAFPEGDAASTHILKFDSAHYRGSSWNEAYVMFLAGRLALPVVEVEPFAGYSLIRRYDREVSPGQSVARIHQEDFCQAAGLPASRKYQAEGGPGFGRCLSLVQMVSSSPAKDGLALIRWQICNVVLGNADGHAKNLSFILGEEGWRLAPFYDIVCTAAYKGVDRNLAMSVGSQYDPGQVRLADWNAFAEDAGIRPRVVLRILDEVSDTLHKRLPDFSAEFHGLFGANPSLEAVRITVADRVRRIRTLMAGPDGGGAGEGRAPMDRQKP